MNRLLYIMTSGEGYISSEPATLLPRLAGIRPHKHGPTSKKLLKGETNVRMLGKTGYVGRIYQ
jgi:hypothetical protein